MKKILIVIGVILLHFIFYNKATALSRDGQPIIAYYFNYWGAPWGKTVDRGWGRWVGNPDSVIGPESWRRNIATGDRITYPLIGPYDSSNPEVVRWQARNAKNTGIDAFAIMLWTYEFDKNDIAGAKSSGYPTWGEQEWKVMKEVTIPTIAQEGFHFILGDEMVEATAINCDYINGPCPLIFGGNANNEQEQHARCNDPATPCMSLAQMPENVRQKLQENNNYLTHKRYADLVLNAYAGLTLAAPPYPYWSAYLRTGNRTNGLPNLPGMPYYYIPQLETYRENHTISFNNSDMGHKLKRSLEVVEELIGGPVAWFGYDGIITWWDSPKCGESCADFWRDFGKIYALVDGFGGTPSFIQHREESDSQQSVNYNATKVNSVGIGFVPNIQTSYDDSLIRNRLDNDWYQAASHSWIKRNNGDTFRRSIRVYQNMPIKPDFYWLSSWNATYLEGYTVEPAITWGDDNSTDPTDPYHYLKILASNLTGANFIPAPLPPAQSIDPLMASKLGILQDCPQTSTLSCMVSGSAPADFCQQRGGTCNSNYSCSKVPGYNCCCEVKTFLSGDLNHDGHVDISDLRSLLQNFTNIFDYNLVVGNFGSP